MNSKCNFCNELVIEKDVVNNNYVQCATCMIPSHRECYNANNAKCMTMGCNGESVYMTPKPTTLPAKLEQMALVESGKNIEQERNLPALTQYIEQEDRLDKIMQQYGHHKNSIRGGTVEILENVYHYPNKLGTHIRDIGESFLNEYSQLEKKMKDIKEQIEQNKVTYISFGICDFILSASLFTSVFLSYITNSWAITLTTGTVLISNSITKIVLGKMQTLQLEKRLEDIERQGLRDLRERYAPRFYIAEQADKKEDTEKQAHNKELEKAQRALEELRQKNDYNPMWQK